MAVASSFAVQFLSPRRIPNGGAAAATGREPLAEAIEQARGELGKDAYASAWNAGATLDLPTAVTRALDVLGEMTAEAP